MQPRAHRHAQHGAEVRGEGMGPRTSGGAPDIWGGVRVLLALPQPLPPLPTRWGVCDPHVTTCQSCLGGRGLQVRGEPRAQVLGRKKRAGVRVRTQT